MTMTIMIFCICVCVCVAVWDRVDVQDLITSVLRLCQWAIYSMWNSFLCRGKGKKICWEFRVFLKKKFWIYFVWRKTRKSRTSVCSASMVLQSALQNVTSKILCCFSGVWQRHFGRSESPIVNKISFSLYLNLKLAIFVLRYEQIFQYVLWYSETFENAKM